MCIHENLNATLVYYLILLHIIMEWPLRRLVIASINNLNKQLLLLDDQPSNTKNELTSEMWHLLPLPERAWERMLFGIFTIAFSILIVDNPSSESHIWLLSKLFL